MKLFHFVSFYQTFYIILFLFTFIDCILFRKKHRMTKAIHNFQPNGSQGTLFN
uniref:Hypothetical secreted peptide n=1 Tax=Glossina morsitans morsitans TaxID=37546 RepID=D3TSI7_GLOMM